MLPVPFRTSELSQLARYSRASGHTPACSTFQNQGCKAEDVSTVVCFLSPLKAKAWWIITKTLQFPTSSHTPCPRCPKAPRLLSQMAKTYRNQNYITSVIMQASTLRENSTSNTCTSSKLVSCPFQVVPQSRAIPGCLHRYYTRRDARESWWLPKDVRQASFLWGPAWLPQVTASVI